MLITVLAVGCSSENDEPDLPGAEEVKATVNPAYLMFEASGTGAKTITVTANGRVATTSDAVWCRLIQKEGDGELFHYVYAVECDDNKATEPRSCSIRVTYNGEELAVIPVSQAGATPEPTPDPEPEVTALTQNEVFEALGLGWNLGNQLDAYNDNGGNETCWGNAPATQAAMNAVKAAGFKSVRIPVTWLGHVGAAPDYKIDAAWLDRVAEVAGYAEKAGLKAIVNIHHDGAESKYWLNIKKAAVDANYNAAVKAQLAAMWTQIATRFADKGEWLLFESMNEIHDGGWGWGDNRTDGGKQYKTFSDWQQTFVDAVRAAGGKNATRWLCVPTYDTNIDLGQYLTLPTDPAKHIIVAVHCYDPYEYTINAQYSEWGHTGAAGKKDQSEEPVIRAELDKMLSRWINRGIPAYIGEFGCVHRDDARSEEFRKYYLEYFTKAASDRKIPICYWDNGSDKTGADAFGIISHSTGAWLNNGKDVAAAMTRGFYTTDASYTLTSVYNNAPK